MIIDVQIDTAKLKKSIIKGVIDASKLEEGSAEGLLIGVHGDVEIHLWFEKPLSGESIFDPASEGLPFEDISVITREG